MSPLDRLASLFEKFPGIGPRQARRFVHYLLSTHAGTRAELADLVRKLGSESSQCKECFRWFVKNHSTALRASGLCETCSNSRRDHGILFVVEKDADIENVERSGYRGLYFVLGGTVPLAAEEPEKHVRIKELLKKIEDGGLKEVILGLSATTEGDHTRLLLQEKILPIAQGLNFKLSSLGRGLSTGSELEYADPETIANALSSRT